MKFCKRKVETLCPVNMIKQAKKKVIRFLKKNFTFKLENISNMTIRSKERSIDYKLQNYKDLILQ